MAIRVGINGFGRMGRLGFRAGWDKPEYDIVHVNEISGDSAAMAHLLEFDSVHGRWDRNITADENAMLIGEQRVSYSCEANSAEVDWAGMGIDLVIECTGVFKTSTRIAVLF